MMKESKLHRFKLEIYFEIEHKEAQELSDATAIELAEFAAKHAVFGFKQAELNLEPRDNNYQYQVLEKAVRKY